jgi:predicted acylesterase/phospholipase RssA
MQSCADQVCSFVCTQSQDTGDVVRLRSYITTRGVMRDVKIWEAARATSVATTLFEPSQINTGERFVDGAVGANNPINEVWTEAQDMWPSLQNKLQCLVSIGTGVPSLSAFVRNDLSIVGKMLVQIATESEGKAEMFRRDKRELDEYGQYFRFNVTSGLKDIGLESSEQLGLILATTRRYIESQFVHKELQACAKMLILEVQRS